MVLNNKISTKAHKHKKEIIGFKTAAEKFPFFCWLVPFDLFSAPFSISFILVFWRKEIEQKNSLYASFKEGSKNSAKKFELMRLLVSVYKISIETQYCVFFAFHYPYAESIFSIGRWPLGMKPESNKINACKNTNQSMCQQIILPN